MVSRRAQLRVVAPAELAPGFRLAGIDVSEAGDASGAADVLDAMLRDADPGIVGVHAPFYAALDPATIERCERATDPIVVPMPAGLGTADGGGHRARITALLQRAVGYHITFTEVGS